MRLRRVEIIIISVTVAFGCFMGGYLAGRSVSAVSITPSVVYQNEAPQTRAPLTVAVSPPVGDESRAPVTEPPTASDSPQEHQPQQPPAIQPPSARDSDGRININTASRSELMDLPGIGSSLSERIVDYRNTNGPFRSIEELRNVSGIGEKRYEAVMNRITVG